MLREEAGHAIAILLRCVTCFLQDSTLILNASPEFFVLSGCFILDVLFMALLDHEAVDGLIDLRLLIHNVLL